MDLKTEEAAKKVAEDYNSTLSELTSIAKVEINALTMLADDNKEYAATIAGCIENRLKHVRPERKLPILYLIDSICKNYPKSSYVQLFTQNIVSNFCDVFKSSGEKVRKSLHKLRMTWDATKTFPPRKLNAIDKRVHEIDPNWPIVNKMNSGGASRHGSNNNNSRNNQNQATTNTGRGQRSTNTQQAAMVQQPDQTDPLQLRNQTMVQQGQQQIPIFSQHHLQNQQQPVHLQQLPQQLAPQPYPPQQLAPQLLQPIAQDQQLYESYPTTNGIYQQPIPSSQTNFQSQSIYNQQQFQSVPQHIQPPPPPPQTIDQGQFLVHQNQGFHTQQPTPMSLSHPYPTPHNDLTVETPVQAGVDSELDSLNSLYGGKQCSSCSLRFVDDKKYAIHLDWHFRQNLKSDNMFVRRKWYYPLDLWVQFREINDDETQENINSDNNVNNDLLISPNQNEAPTAPASKDDEKNTCPVCHEAFEKYWSEEDEEWRLKNARQHDDDKVYHPLCLSDMSQTSIVQ